MIFEARTEFPKDTIRFYVFDKESKLEQHPIVKDFPGAPTAWQRIPDNKYRTLFGADGLVAYLFKIDSKGTAASSDSPSGRADSMEQLGRKVSFREKDRLEKDMAIYWGAETQDDTGKDEMLAAFTTGILLGTYETGHYRSDKKSHPLAATDAHVYVLGERKGLVDTMGRAYQVADTRMRCMDLVNAPANKKRPQDLAQWALESGERFEYSVRVLDKGRCEAEGMGALLAVNRGSEDPARFVIMEYQGNNAPEKPTVIIGKGVTFDTGGVSIKGSANLHLMKSDMGGAAAVFGTLETVARLRLPVNVVGLVPLTDNSVDALSIKPSDVISGHSGKTIEIIDTDAEGRLIMSDALSYGVTHYDAHTLIDIATLTGSAVRTFGYQCAALFSKNEELVRELRAAGDRAGERCWPLPMWDEYKSGLDSDVADIKNFSGKPINGAIDAAKFLEFFTEEHPRFAHIDIAGVAIKAGAYAKDRLATGFGIGLLVSFLEGSGD